MFFNNRVLFAATLIVLAGCGGGGSAAAPGIPAPAPSATTTPGSASTLQSARLTLTFPVSSAPSSKQRSPKFIDGENTTTIVTTIISLNGQPLPSALSAYATTTATLSTSGPTANCSTASGFETCTLAIPAPAGSVTYEIDAKDSAGTVLSTATTTQTITVGAANAFSIALGGIVTGPYGAGIVPISLTAGTPSTGSLYLSVYDPDGVTIQGSAPYVGGPLTLASQGTHITFATSAAGPYSSSVSVPSGDAAAALYYKYDGHALAQTSGETVTLKTGAAALIKSFALTSTNSNPVISGLTTASTANGSSVGAVNYGQGTEIFDATGQTQTSVTASEVGVTPAAYGNGTLNIQLAASQPAGAGSDNGDGTYNAANCAAVVTSLTIGAPDAAGDATISATSGVAGICEAEVYDAYGDDTTFFISVTTASGTIDAKHRASR